MVKNHDFSDVVAQNGATRFFTENPAVLGNSLYAPLSSCKKAKKSIAGKYHNFWRTTDPDNKITKWIYPQLPTEVENTWLVTLDERNMILTCGFHGKFDEALDFHFQ